MIFFLLGENDKILFRICISLLNDLVTLINTFLTGSAGPNFINNFFNINNNLDILFIKEN